MIQFANHDLQILVIQLALKMIQIMIRIHEMGQKVISDSNLICDLYIH